MNVLMVYLRRSILYLVPLTKSGRIFLEVEPVTMVNANDSSEIIGSALISAFAATGSEYPVDLPLPKNMISPAQKAAKVSSWKHFASGTRCVEIEKSTESFVLTPLRPDEGGFSEDSGKTATLHISSTWQDVAKALTDLLSQCEEV